MRKSVVISSIVTVLIVVAAIGSGLAIRHNNNQQQAQEVAAAQQAQKLAEWQAKVKAWNAEQMQKKQTANAATGLQQQGVTQLPKTGISSNMIIVLAAVVVAGYAFKSTLLRRQEG